MQRPNSPPTRLSGLGSGSPMARSGNTSPIPGTSASHQASAASPTNSWGSGVAGFRSITPTGARSPTQVGRASPHSRGAAKNKFFPETKPTSAVGGSPTRSRDSSFPHLSRPSSREQVLTEFASMSGEQPQIDRARTLKNMTRVEFQVSVQTDFGDAVFVVGSTAELGFWDPNLALPLATSPEAFPFWSESFSLSSGRLLEYKYLIKRGNGEFEWETKISNRQCTPEGTLTSLEDGKFNEERAKLLNKDFVSVPRVRRMGRHFTDAEVSIEKSDCIYILSYRLPIITDYDPVQKKYVFQWLSFVSDSRGGEMHSNKVMRSMSRHGMYVVESLRELRDKCKVWYVGGLGLDIPAEHREAVTDELASMFQCIPVFVESAKARDFEDFCHDTLKPIFHFVHPTSQEVCVSFNNAIDAEQRSRTEGAKWQLYCAVNLEYVQPIVQNFNDGDCVFAFDLELLMCPTLLGSRARTANICFFFNTPFPSAEIFRTIPVRKQILRSLLNADFIQFHCFTYARHFLSCCTTLLGLEYRPTRGGLIHLVFNGHHCHVRASHVGIDAVTLGTRLQEESVLQEQKKWQAKLRESNRQVLLVGYDDMEPLAGITLKLKAYRSLLHNFPVYRTSALLIQVAITLHDSLGNVLHSEYVDQVNSLRDEINSLYPGSLLMIHEKMAFTPRCALFSVSDVLINSAVRHGLSLVPFEYVLSSEVGDGKKGSLLLSEFAACSRVIPGAMRFSPWKDEDVSKAIVKCLRQPHHERRYWHEQQTAWCKNNTVLRWAENILDDMKKVRTTMVEMGEDVKRSASCRVGLVKSTYKEISSNALKQEQVFRAFTETKTRLIILDVDLLIRPKEEEASDARPAIKALEQLVEESGNYVFLLSNETRENLLKWLRNMRNLDKIGLAAEDGYYYKWPGSPVDRWDIRQEVRTDFKDISNVLMQQYAVRTTGTFVEDDKVASITWHFGSTNREFGQMQGKELLTQLKDTMAHLPVDVVMGKSFVRVRHEGVNKGTLVKHIVSHYNVRGGADFILCLADDRMDEDVFVVLRDYQHDVQYRVFQGTEQEVKVFLCTVGRQPSLAAYCLYTLDDVHELIRGLSVQTKRKMRDSTGGGRAGGIAQGGSGGLRAAATMLELSGSASMKRW